MFTEKNTGTNLPAQIELYATQGSEYKFLFIAKGGGSANKTFLFQQTKALLNPEKLMKFIEEKIKVIWILNLLKNFFKLETCLENISWPERVHTLYPLT